MKDVLGIFTEITHSHKRGHATVLSYKPYYALEERRRTRENSIFPFIEAVFRSGWLPATNRPPPMDYLVYDNGG
jgi:hypothetical protein